MAEVRRGLLGAGAHSAAPGRNCRSQCVVWAWSERPGFGLEQAWPSKLLNSAPRTRRNGPELVSTTDNSLSVILSSS